MTNPTVAEFSPPKLMAVRPRWGNDDPLSSFLQQAAFDGFDGVELGFPTQAKNSGSWLILQPN